MAKIPVVKRITSRELESSQYPNVFRYVQHPDGSTGILVEDGFQFEVTSPEALEGIQAAQSAATQARDIASAAQDTAQEARGNALAETLAFSYIEHRYARATAQPDTPMGVDPVGWTLTVPAGTETVWLSYASKRGDGALLSAWSTPATRMDSHPWMIFKRSTTVPEMPSGVTPAGWYFAPPAGLEPLWASSGRFVYEGGAGAGVVRPHPGLRPRSGLHPSSPSWSTPYLAVNATTGRNYRYLGKFTTHPLSRAGDTWLIYGVGDTPVQRGVWINESGTRRRLTSETAADSLYIAQALSDILEVANAGYGVVSDYGAVTFIANLASNAAFISTLVADTAFIDTLSANVAFVEKLLAHDIDATGSITGALLKTNDGLAMMSRQAEDTDGYKGITISDRAINESSPAGKVLQLAYMSSYSGLNTPAMIFKHYGSGAWQLDAFIYFMTSLFNALIIENRYAGLQLALAAGGNYSKASLTKSSTSHDSSDTSIFEADYINANKTVCPQKGVEVSRVAEFVAASTFGNLYDAISDYIPLGHRVRLGGSIGAGYFVYATRTSGSNIQLGMYTSSLIEISIYSGLTQLCGKGYITV